ncbi:GNAT family N-acetyltransferase [Streptomyces sp. NBC_01803]|uniref:GNAT family N-acetyltransferase n=1 Tax=Streptomyces sp. NBC_01803 TaxID=2975946 RepID=UPI002DDBE45A|nr:GNAT family N-acetyltransferase [Streptomyces sp. NBC_01803]WSA46915.1 GNAT family N-acetyltransferase [Streptomyces sp. NBC_01803]
MTILVREFTAADAEAVAEVRRSAVPHMVCTGEAVAWEAASAPPGERLRWLVAEEAGRITGCADAGLRFDSAEPGQAFLHTAVRPQARGRGAGAALVVAAEQYLTGLGARVVHTWVADDGRSPAFAARHGYERRRRARFLGLDLATAELPPLPPESPPGVELRPTSAFAADPRPLYEADVECVADEPGEVTLASTPYEDWYRLDWERPDLDHELSTVALVDGEVAAYSLARTDGRERYGSAMTGTRRAYRGRGLAKLAKLASLHRARTRGYLLAFTGNDAANIPMLKINEWLGYRPAADEWRYAKEL